MSGRRATQVGGLVEIHLPNRRLVTQVALLVERSPKQPDPEVPLVTAVAGMVEYTPLPAFHVSYLAGMIEYGVKYHPPSRVTLLAAMAEWGVAEQKRRRRFGPAAQCL